MFAVGMTQAPSFYELVLELQGMKNLEPFEKAFKQSPAGEQVI